MFVSVGMKMLYNVVSFWCRTNWISHMYPYIPPLLSLHPSPHPALLGHQRAGSWAPWTMQQFPTSCISWEGCPCVGVKMQEQQGQGTESFRYSHSCPVLSCPASVFIRADLSLLLHTVASHNFSKEGFKTGTYITATAAGPFILHLLLYRSF